MAGNNEYKRKIYISKTIDQSINRVHLNPNFKRTDNFLKPSNLMYVNPNFSQQFPSIQQNNILQKSKIYVNPNFVRSSNTVICHQSSASTSTVNHEIQNKLLNHEDSIPIPFVNKTSPLPSVHTAKSRYCLVRKTNENTILEVQPLKKVTTTFKINKYKSVSLQGIKKNLDTAQFLPIPLNKATTSKSTNSQIIQNAFESRFKIIKRNTDSLPISTEMKLTFTRKPAVYLNRNQRLNLKAKLRTKKHFKKNNIPCPLFRKYGKCLRNIHGNCEFLHDKKHVSICRRFLKGVCHDKECLLSHDLTAKKMPTCSFYLKGMCTKDSCPYLHVKLNEKTKICTDFLKGYCEKGDKCLNRHINICPEMATKGFCAKKQCPYPHKSNKTIKKTKKTIKTSNLPCKSYRTVRRISKSKTDSMSNTNNSPIGDHRYYKDVIDHDEIDEVEEVIKPTRCKLGILPSFIQL